MKTRIALIALIIIASTALNAQTIMNIHQSNGTVLQIPLNTIDSITYTISNPGSLASITTTAVTSITGTTAFSGGNIINDGGAVITQRGICYSINPSPTTADTIRTSGNGTGSFTCLLSVLTPSTTYYVRAYAVNSAGTSYGNEVSFTTGIGVITNYATEITANTAVSGGNITTNGGSPITERGVCFGTNAYPTTANTTIISGSGMGSFTCNLTALMPNTTYYVRAYAINNAGTAYGNLIVFTTNTLFTSTPGAGVTFDGYTYSSIVLGNGQEWMAENLRTTLYANGDPIPNVSDNIQWGSLTTGAWGYYNNDSQYENPYGKLYNWHTVVDSRNVCPTGWHVPSDPEWTIFCNYFLVEGGGFAGYYVAGGKVKSTGTQYWQAPNTNATNEIGFSGLPGGVRGTNGVCGDVGSRAWWWSSTEFNAGSASFREVVYNGGSLSSVNIEKTFGLSVRCLKD
jgi:uncharacterized protein (TIGR02145 family)